jgi:hypothetical protein
MGAGWNSTNNYRLSEITYDKNGNIKTLQRNDLNGISSNFGFADDKYKYTLCCGIYCRDRSVTLALQMTSTNTLVKKEMLRLITITLVQGTTTAV